MTHRRAYAVGPAALLALALLTGCDSSPPAAEGPSPHLTFLQTRSLEGTQRAQVRVVNDSERDLEVDEVGLDWAGFPGPPDPFRYRVASGRTLDLPYDLPAPDCRPAAGREPAYAVVVTAGVTLREGLDAAGRRFLARLWHGACDEERIARVVSLGWGSHWESEGHGEDSVFHGRLLLTRGRDDEAVRVTSVKGSVLFELALPGAATLPPGVARRALPLEVRRGRCDEHGRSQSTQTFVWRVFLALGDQPPVSHIVALTGAQQSRLQAFLDRACASHVGG